MDCAYAQLRWYDNLMDHIREYGNGIFPSEAPTMQSPFFRERLDCPSCGGQPRVRPFFAAPYGQGAVRDFIDEYYDGRVPGEVLRGAELRIERCADCGAFWHRYVLDDAGMERLYEHWINHDRSLGKRSGYDPSAAFEICRHITQHLDQIPTRDGPHRVLDIGGGWGQWSRLAMVLGCESYFFDISARRSAHVKNLGLQVLTDLPAALDGTFDLVNMAQILEHVPDPRAFLGRTATLLRPGGGCVISVPFARRSAKVASQGPFHPLEHINGFTPRALVRLIGACGLVPKADLVRSVPLSPRALARAMGRNAVLRLLPPARFPMTTNQFAIKPPG